MFIGDIVRRSGRYFGDRPAITFGTRSVSFAAFDEYTDRLGNALIASGLRRGERVAVLVPNSIEYLVVTHAVAKAGLVLMALNPRDTPEDQEYRIVDSEARALITDDLRSPSVEMTFGLDAVTAMMHTGPAGPCAGAVCAEDTYRIAYTGGTTGRSKGVDQSMRGKLAEMTNFLMDYIPGTAAGDTMLHAAPVTHASGSLFLPHLARGACNVIMPLFDPGEYLEVLQQTQATATFLVPTMIAMILDDPNIDDVETPSLRRLCYGASPIAPTLAEKAQRVFGQLLCQTYGQAEAPMTIACLLPGDHDRVGSAGRAYTMSDVRIFDPDDRPLPPGGVGEVVVRGPVVMKGYWNRPEATAEALRGGWLHTGDIGHMDEDGFVYLTDRRHDVIISGGFNVYPREVEDALTNHPAVREAAVVGVPDEKWGEVVCAVVSTRQPVAEQNLLDHARKQLAGYKRPRQIQIWAELPKSSVGKILRRDVRDRFQSQGRPR